MKSNKVKARLDYLIKVNKMHIDQSKKYWEDKNISHAFIVGYLEQSLKKIVNDLEEISNEISA